MPEFAYIARDNAGQKVTGTISANTEREVVAILSGKSLFPVEVSTEKARTSGLSRTRIGGQLMANTYSQLASLLRSGVPLLRSIQVLRNQTSNVRLKEVLDDVYRRVEDGSTLADAMSRYPRVFREIAIHMARAGGEGGFLEDALEGVATFTEQQEDLKSRTAGALAYPVFLGVVGTGVVSALIIFFVPKFATMFEDLRRIGELPMLTDWLLTFSGALRQYGLYFAVVAVAAFILLKRQLDTERGKRFRDLLKLKMPILGPVFTSLAVSRFCRVLGTLLHHGVPILKSLEISRDASGNRVLSEAVQRASENISSGQALAKPLAACEYFPPTVVEMISVAEESNTLEKVLVGIADGLERRTTRRLDLAVRLLEPVMLLMLAVVVLCVVIALLMPIMKMSSTLRH